MWLLFLTCDLSDFCFLLYVTYFVILFMENLDRWLFGVLVFSFVMEVRVETVFFTSLVALDGVSMSNLNVQFGFCWSENRCSSKSSSKCFYVHYGAFWWGRLSGGSLFPHHAVSPLAVDRLISLTPPVPIPVSLSALCGFVFISELEKHASRADFLQSKPGWNTEIRMQWRLTQKSKKKMLLSALKTTFQPEG